MTIIKLLIFLIFFFFNLPLNNMVPSVFLLPDFKLLGSYTQKFYRGFFSNESLLFGDTELNDAEKHFQCLAINFCIYTEPEREVIVGLGSTGFLCSCKLGQ